MHVKKCIHPSTVLNFKKAFLCLPGIDATNKQARNHLGTPGGVKSFLRGVQIFELCPIVLNHVQHIFPGGGENFSSAGEAPSCAP